MALMMRQALPKYCGAKETRLAESTSVATLDIAQPQV